MPVDHPENFPVASFLLPARLRAPIEALYAFARGADDIADEGDLPDAARLEGLDRYRRALDEIERGGTPAAPPFARLAQGVRDHGLPLPLLRDLLDAFAQDVVKKRYATYEELAAYARRSANPVGRLVLHLFGRTDPESLRQSDHICSALQYINFWQDVAIDWGKGRVYLPQEDLRRFGVGEAHIAEGRVDAAWTRLMAFETGRSKALLLSGMPLANALPGRLGLEIRATVHGGATIADRITAVAGDVFRRRPTLRRRDWIAILLKSISKAAAS